MQQIQNQSRLDPAEFSDHLPDESSSSHNLLKDSEHSANGSTEFGGVWVRYEYCISLLLLTIRIHSRIHYCHAWPSRILLGVPYSLIALLLGPWGIPWGPVLTIRALWVNLSGGLVERRLT